ncbi:MAG: SAM-dependent methyltransferase [Alphaproteobacteria bacterium]|jgi:NADH dehydrogenase [ubiquinone] 1 alpha subcomplex assembly factor 7|nr:SAM-dependent methyltransferase [Alphaproteobacteria bacterium]
MATPLDDLLRRRIAAEGPITVADYMAEALGHPAHGYYMGRDPFGRAGDFTTAPEISQMFGELLGLWCAKVWHMMGSPSPIDLVELGPGRGTLMADALRAIDRAAPDCRAALAVHLVETSPALRQRQRETLAEIEVQWHERFEQAPDGPLLLLANEFFDALPIRQFVCTKDGWRERMVGVADGNLCFTISSDPVDEASIPDSVREAAETGDIAEARPMADDIAAAIARRIAVHGGAALVVDYGHAASAAGDTLQAVRGHAFAEVLADPGAADLTAHVDFAALARAASPHAAVHGPVDQGVLLRRLGIEARADKLLATADQATEISAALARLIGAGGMGTLFEALAIAHPDLGALPGFEG